MNHRPWGIVLGLAGLGALLASCAAPQPAPVVPVTPAAAAATTAPAPPAAAAPTAVPATPVPPPAQPAAGPTAAAPAPVNPLLAVRLTDARSGQGFTLAEAQAGQVLVLAPMATWCTTCTAQARQIQALQPDEGIVVVALGVDEGETAQQFAAHLQRNGLTPARAALAPRELRQLLVQQLGPTAINTTTAPVIVSGPDGQVRLLRPGIKSAADLRAELATVRN